MGNGIYLALKDFCAFFGTDGIFLSVLILSLLIFKVFLLVSLFSAKTGKRWRFFYFLPFLSLFLLFCATIFTGSFGTEEIPVYLCLFLFFGLSLFSLLFFLPEKKKKPKVDNITVNPEQKRFLSLLAQDVRPKEKEFPSIEIPTEKPKTEVDFSHVKNVIKRIEKVPVSSSEKKQLQDLSVLLYRAENGDSELKKSEINDALGNLLKIMSKYGA